MKDAQFENAMNDNLSEISVPWATLLLESFP